MRVSKEDCKSPSTDLMQQAAAFSGREHSVEKSKIVFRVCPFCEEDDGPRYAKNYRSSWFMGDHAGGFRCVKCEKVAGPYLVFKALGIEIEGDDAPVALRSFKPLAKVHAAAPVSGDKVEEQHARSVALLMMDEAGAPVRKYLEGRGLMPGDEYVTRSREKQTIGAWRYKDGKLGVAWWYFDPVTKKPVGCKYRLAKERFASKKERGMGRWPVDESERPPYMAHLLDLTHHEIVVCEGESDAETLVRCGVTNVLSPPDGADSVDCLFDYVEKASKIYLVCDNDRAGFSMRNKIHEWRHGDQFFLDVIFYKDLCRGAYKDVNEAYVAKGEEYVLDCLSKAAEPGEIKDFRIPILIKTGFNSLDSQYFGLIVGGYSHICGKPGEGKTTWALSLMDSIVKSSDAMCSFVSLEQGVLDTNAAILSTMAGLDPSVTRYESAAVVKNAIAEKLKDGAMPFKCFGRGHDWHENGSADYDAMLKAVRSACFYSRGSLVVVDNFAILRDALTSGKGAITDFAAASKVASDMLALSMEGECHVMLINHISGGGNAYGKSRLNPYADVSWRVVRVGARTELRCEKSRSSRGGKCATLKYVMGPNGLLLDAGYSITKSRGPDSAPGDPWNEGEQPPAPPGPVNF